MVAEGVPVWIDGKRYTALAIELQSDPVKVLIDRIQSHLDIEPGDSITVQFNVDPYQSLHMRWRVLSVDRTFGSETNTTTSELEAIDPLTFAARKEEE